MQSNGQQAADAIKIITPTFKAAGLTTKITCCDGSGYYAQQALMSGLSTVYSFLDTVVVHPYSSALSGVLTNQKPIWQGEYSDQKSPWDPLWFNTTSGGSKGDGLTWATNIQSAFTKANVTAYLYWIGAEYGNLNTMLVRLNGADVTIPKRYWAFAQFSRFVRPGARRVSITSTNTALTTSAFVNANGTLAIQVINTGTANVTVDVKGVTGESVTAWLSNEANNLSLIKANIGLAGTGVINATVPAKSLVSFLV
jgi:O-glycosyl hydrolase